MISNFDCAEYFEMNKEKLFKVLNYASSKTAYYRDVINMQHIKYIDFTYDYFKELPLLTKKSLTNNDKYFISDDYNINDLIKENTSGTSGQILTCYKSKKERITLSNMLWKCRRKHIHNLTPDDKCGSFYSSYQLNNGEIVTSKIMYDSQNIMIPMNDLSESCVMSLISEIIRFSPRWFRGRPAITLQLIAQICHKNNIKFDNLCYIELDSEFCKKEDLEFIKNVFKCDVSNHYGSREVWNIAFSCNNNMLHPTNQNVFIESLYNNSIGASELVITSLVNQAWPIIRYKIGDLGSLFRSDCTCKFNTDYCLNLTSGRTSDHLEFSNGQHINAVLFSAIIRRVNLKYGGVCVKQFRVEKISNFEINIKIVFSEDKLSSNIINEIDKNLRNIIKENIKIIYCGVNFIHPDKKTGKHKEFVDLSNNDVH